MNRKRVVIILTTIFLSSELFSLNFLINIFYSILPRPVRSAFKGEGLQIDQFEYGFGNCNFSSFGYLNSDIHYVAGNVINEKFKFEVPTFYLYGGYISHVSTPILTTVYPGWQLETEIGYGGISYNPTIPKKYRQLFFTGSSGFNWRIYKSKQENVRGFTINLLTGYKLHYILKDLLYYGIQIGATIYPKFSISSEFYETYKGGNFFIFSQELTSVSSKETHISLSLNFILSKKYLLKFAGVYKYWFLEEFKSPKVEERVNLYGIVISLVSR